MWSITLGYTPPIVSFHWQLYLKWDEAVDDESLNCPEECDGGATCDHYDDTNFELSKDDRIIPIHPIQTVHVVRNDTTGYFEYQHATPLLLDDTIQETEMLGLFSDVHLASALLAFRRIPLPNTEKQEHCQDWVKMALQVLQETGLLVVRDRENYRRVLDEVLNQEVQ